MPAVRRHFEIHETTQRPNFVRRIKVSYKHYGGHYFLRCTKMSTYKKSYEIAVELDHFVFWNVSGVQI